MNNNTEASINNLEMSIGQFSRQLEAQASSSEKINENCKSLELRNKLIPSNPKMSDKKGQSWGKEKNDKEVKVEKEVEEKSDGEKGRSWSKMKLEDKPLIKL